MALPKRNATALRKALMGIVELSILIAVLLGACSYHGRSASPSVGAADCKSFDRETVGAVAWSSRGDFLVVDTSSDADGQGRVRVFAWPGMSVVSDAETDALAVDDAAIDDHGGVYWFTSDPLSNSATSTRLRKLEPGGTPTVLGGAVQNAAYIGLLWGGGLIAMELDPGPPEQSRLVRIDIAHPEAAPVGLTAWTRKLWSTYWADRSGEWLVWDEYEAPGEPQDFVVLHHGQRQVIRPPGYGGGEMTLSPDHRLLIYQRTETARLTVLNLKSGQVEGELSPLEFYGGEISSAGVLAGLTAHGPGESNQLCLLDVSARL